MPLPMYNSGMPGVERVTPQMLRLLGALLEDPDADWWGLALAEVAGIRSATVYRALARLEGVDWVSSAWEEIDPVHEGRPRRRLYRLTSSGAREARRVLAEPRSAASRAPTSREAGRRLRPA